MAIQAYGSISGAKSIPIMDLNLPWRCERSLRLERQPGESDDKLIDFTEGTSSTTTLLA